MLYTKICLFTYFSSALIVFGVLMGAIGWCLSGRFP